MKNVFDVMPRPTAELFLRLEHEPLLKPFVLIGGTALALYLGHRKSEDLDFITTTERLPRVALKALIRKLQAEGRSVRQNDNLDAYEEFQTAGMDLADYSQTMVVDEEVSVTFFAADAHHKKILIQETLASSGPRIATQLELSQLKALVATTRSNSRDWLDLCVLEKEHGFSLGDWKETYDKAGLSNQQFENALTRICSGVTSANDPGFESLLPNPPTIEEISAHFKALRKAYEIDLARTTLGNDPISQ